MPTNMVMILPWNVPLVVTFPRTELYEKRNENRLHRGVIFRRRRRLKSMVLTGLIYRLAIASTLVASSAGHGSFTERPHPQRRERLNGSRFTGNLSKEIWKARLQLPMFRFTFRRGMRRIAIADIL